VFAFNALGTKAFTVFFRLLRKR